MSTSSIYRMVTHANPWCHPRTSVNIQTHFRTCAPSHAPDHMQVDTLPRS